MVYCSIHAFGNVLHDNNFVLNKNNNSCYNYFDIFDGKSDFNKIPASKKTGNILVKHQIVAFLGALLKPKEINFSGESIRIIEKVANKFSEDVLSLSKENITCQNIQDIVNKYLPEACVNVKDMSELHHENTSDTFAAYEVTTEGNKNLYVNFDVDLNSKKDYARLVEALVHEFTHAMQRNSESQLERMHDIVKQRGLMNSLNNTFFKLEGDLFKYFTNMKYYTPKKEISRPGKEELLNYFQTSREGLNKNFQELLLSSLISRVNVDRELATEFYVNELTDEAQAYKIALSTYKKVMGTEGKYSNYELFNVLLTDMTEYLQKRSSYKPVFLEKTDSAYSENANLLIDIELGFGKETIIKHFKELESGKPLSKKEEDLSVFELLPEFNRESLNDLYVKVLKENFSKYEKPQNIELMKTIKIELDRVTALVKKHLKKLKQEYGRDNMVYNADYIPLIYQDFADFIEKKCNNFENI